MQLTLDQQAYSCNFVRDYSRPYATQNPNARYKGWLTKDKNLTGLAIVGHVDQKYWVATKASWYPAFFFLDFDQPKPGAVERAIEHLGLSEGQYAVMTSPSYEQSRNCHVALRLEYRGKLPTHRLGYEALIGALGSHPEVYPQKRRKFRLPFGRDQFLMSQEGEVLRGLTWREGMHYLCKLDPIPIESLPHQPELPSDSPIKDEDNPRRWRCRADVAQLHEEGLQAFGTRNKVQWWLAEWLWRSNWLPTDAIAHIKGWIRRKHNGYSKEVHRGAWRVIDGEIEREVKWIWTYYRPYPDTPHNLDGAVTRADLEWAAHVYRGDVVNQKRLINLVSYYRPRAHHEWVYIPRRIWSGDVASKDSYKTFTCDLEQKGLLETVHAYRHVSDQPNLSFSKKYRLRLPSVIGEPISRDARHVTDYYDALATVYNSRREIADMTGIERTTLWRHFKSKDLLL